MTNLNRNMAHVKNFLFGFVNKEFLIFLFFLALSGTFWLLMTLNESYEKELKIPVYLTNIPKNVIITSQICYADKFFSKTHLDREKTVEKAERSIAKFGDEGLERFKHWEEIFG